jgi:arylsulfatase A-like enzyme
VVSSHPVCVPDDLWERERDTGRWYFRASASFLCAVEDPGSDITFLFRPERAARGCRPELRWDGEEPGHVSAGRDGGLTATVSGRGSTVGRHRLTLSVAGREACEPARFLTMGYESRGITRIFDARRRWSYRYISDFLDRGQTGLSSIKREGLLFVGPGSARIGLQLSSERTLSAYLENASTMPAEFSVTAGSKTSTFLLAPAEGRQIRLGMLAGARRVDFAVRGDSQGAYLWGAPAVSDQVKSTPIVLVTLDTTRRDALSPYGAPAELTPSFARFAQTATVFENAYATSPWTLPSHGSLMTGLYPSKHGLGVTAGRLAAPTTTVADLLKQRGYLTAGFAGGVLCSFRYGVARGFQVYREPDDGFETRGDRLTRHVETFLARNDGRPLFLFANYFDPHAPYLAPPEFLALTAATEQGQLLENVPVWSGFAQGRRDAWKRIQDGTVPLAEHALAFLRSVYLAEVAFMDAQFGRLVAELERLGLYDPALVVVVADHGEALGERGYFSHARRLYPEIMAIPLMVKWPGQRRPRRVTDLVSLIDLFPTILHAAGAQAPPRDGLLLTRRGLENSPGRAHVLMEEHAGFAHPSDPLFVAPHLYGLQGEARLHVVWEGAQQCFASPHWHQEPCREDWRQALAAIGRHLPRREAAGGVLRAADEEKLRALGYMR